MAKQVDEGVAELTFKCVYIIYKNIVRISQRTQKTNRLNFRGGKIAVYSENHTKQINTRIICGENAELSNSKADGTYNNHCSSRSQGTISYMQVSRQPSC
jgi:hypothetical protein